MKEHSPRELSEIAEITQCVLFLTDPQIPINSNMHDRCSLRYLCGEKLRYLFWGIPPLSVDSVDSHLHGTVRACLESARAATASRDCGCCGSCAAATATIPKELTVSFRFEGDFAAAFREGRADGLPPGETLKNLVHRTARETGRGEIEEFGLALCDRVLKEHPAITRARVEITEQSWARLEAGGRRRDRHSWPGRRS